MIFIKHQGHGKAWNELHLSVGTSSHDSHCLFLKGTSCNSVSTYLPKCVVELNTDHKQLVPVSICEDGKRVLYRLLITES